MRWNSSYNVVPSKLTLSVLSFFLVWALNSSAKPIKDSTDWILIYYAPYDNNLSHFSDSILNQLSSVSNYENVRVVFQVDKDDTLGMYRYTISPEGIHLDTIPSETITSGKQLTNYLNWIQSNFAFEKSAVFFLDHGGGLNEVGQDIYPDSTFLTTGDIRKSLRRFNRKNHSMIDLVYLQVCAKASIEPLYEFHDIASYTLASQKLLGAPNNYYEGLLENIDQLQDGDGATLAKNIVDSEDYAMYNTLTCINNSEFGAVKLRFRELVKCLDLRGEITVAKEPKTFEYGNDRYWDLIDFLECINLTEPHEIAARDSLIASIQNDLIVFKRKSGYVKDNFSGISIAVPGKDKTRAYWNMRFFREFRMDRLPLE